MVKGSTYRGAWDNWFEPSGREGYKYPLREDTHKKRGFFSGRTTKVLPSLHQWLFFLSYNSLKRILTNFFLHFWAKKDDFFFGKYCFQISAVNS